MGVGGCLCVRVILAPPALVAINHPFPPYNICLPFRHRLRISDGPLTADICPVRASPAAQFLCLEKAIRPWACGMLA